LCFPLACLFCEQGWAGKDAQLVILRFIEEGNLGTLLIFTRELYFG
jgi:hypothetical protein